MKKIISYLIAAMMVFTMVPGIAFADSDSEPKSATESINLYIQQYNPIYSDEERTVEVVESVPLAVNEDMCAPNGAGAAATAATVDEATALLRAGMVKRQSEIVIKMKIAIDEFSEEVLSAKLDAIYKKLFDHTGNPQEGDALKWVYKECPASLSATGDGTNFYAVLTFMPTYYTTAEQEAELTAAVEQLKTKLALEGKSDYEKVKAIYNYMTANISYDYANLNDEAYELKYTAYAALINKTSVCQGYATLFYRMACEYGIDARVIAGISLNNKGNKERHAWNIVKLGDKYYDLDATWDSTWDADKSKHDFFLKGDASFDNHDRDAEYMTAEFNAKYPISGTEYVPVIDSEAHMFKEVTVAPTCTEPGQTKLVCIGCGKTIVTSTTLPTGHKPDVNPIIEPTCEKDGLKVTVKCTVCGEIITEQEVIPALGHTSKKTVTKATTKKAGSVVETCKTCGKQLSRKTISRIKAPVFKNVKFVYDAKVKKPAITINNYAGGKLKSGTDYYVKFKNQQGKAVTAPKAVGKYTVTVTFKGNYSGTVSKTFTINPKATAITKLTKPGKKQIKVTWQKRTAQVTGYEIQYSTTKNFTKKTTKTLKVKSYKTNTKTIKQLKAKKKYWVKIRTYKTVGKKTYYSAWSKTRTVTTK